MAKLNQIDLAERIVATVEVVAADKGVCDWSYIVQLCSPYARKGMALRNALQRGIDAGLIERTKLADGTTDVFKEQYIRLA